MTGFNLDGLVIGPTQEMLTKIAGFIPTLIGTLMILVIGGVVAHLVRVLVEKVLDMAQFDEISSKIGFTKILKKGDINMKPAKVLGSMVYFVTMLMVLVLVLNTLGIGFTTTLIDGLIGYLPAVISGLFVFILGIFLANFISVIVRMVAKNVNFPKTHILEEISRWAIVVFAITITLKELGLGFIFEGPTFTILFTAICFAFALAFGLGGKDAASHYIKDLQG